MWWKRVFKIIFIFLAVGMWILTLPVNVEEGAETWERWLGIPLEDVMNILYQQFGWPSTLLAVAATEPPRVYRRLVSLSQAAMADSSNC